MRRLALALAPLALSACAAFSSWDGFSGAPAESTAAKKDAGEADHAAPGETTPDAGPAPIDATADAGPPIAFVQATSNADDSDRQTVQVSLKQQRAGDLVVVAAGWFNDNADIQSVTDSSGKPYLVAAPSKIYPGDSNTACAQAIYYLPGAPAAAENVITVTWNRVAFSPDVRALEYSGLDPTAPFEVASANSGIEATATSGSVTARAGRALLVAASTTQGDFTSAGADQNLRIITADTNLAQDRIVAVPGTFSSSAPLQRAAPFVMQLAVFH